WRGSRGAGWRPGGVLLSARHTPVRRRRRVVHCRSDVDLPRLGTVQSWCEEDLFMAAQRPEEGDFEIAGRTNAGDLEGAVGLYESDARFVAGPDNTVEGSDGIREVMRSMLAGKPRLTIEVPKVVQTGDVALLCSKWS